MRRGIKRLQQLDSHSFKRVSSGHSPLLDSLLLPLSRLANKSLLWVLIALGLAAGGGRFGRRAALRGLVSISMTSLVVNQPLKRIARRHRPALLPKPRRLLARPASYSFPSGHAASAAAFSTAVGMELPALAFPVGAVAFGVAYSRVYLGAHYPSDVAAGAGVGLAIGLATRRYWPLASRRAAEVQPVWDPTSAPAIESGEGLNVVVNPSAGAGTAGRDVEQLQEALPQASIIRVENGATLGRALELAVRDCLAIGIAGGDGSVNAAAAAALEAEKPLLVIPAGTLNHLARDLGISSVDDAVRALKQGSAVAVDVGLIAGKPFLNTASFGGYADFVDAREKLEPSIGKWPAMFVALVRQLTESAPVEVKINGRIRKLWMIFVGNCCYRPSGFAPTWRDRLDDGKLDVRLVDASPPWGKLRLLLAVATGTLAKSRVYEEFVTDKLEVECLRGELLLAKDGEIFDGPARFSIEKSSGRLPMYRPKEGLGRK